ncbi:uncharacterized protein LOC135351459 [Halichondria panicea]|uniref:uncharacterized protein LOC135351459 n=1 Tax=Halichondria panicea TaxID=6063 RepID=UPI00312BC25F
MDMDVLKEVFSGESESTSTIDTMIHTRTDDKSLHAQDNIGGTSQTADHERPELLRSLPGLSLSSHSGAELDSVPEEMPMYLLEDDEGNDEEIIRLLDPPALPSPSRPQPTVSLVFPWTSLGLNVTPIQVIPSSPPNRKKRHGGGWPKGKSRKSGVAPPPKPPSSGYGLFLSEHMAGQKIKSSGSMSQVSKQLGRLWSALSQQDKEVYNDRSSTERTRYLSELRRYLLTTSGVTVEDVDRILSQTLAIENNDSLLLCDLCKLTFTSLHNKRCHYSGRLHTAALVETLQPQPSSGRNETMVSRVSSEAVKCSAVSTQTKEAMRGYTSLLQCNASLAQTLTEQEYLYTEASAVLSSLEDQWTLLWGQLQALMTLHTQQSVNVLH